MSYRPKLEPYNGGRGRHTCPSCGGRKEFTRYLNERGEHYADHVGICNRRESCGYQYPPRRFFLDNPQFATRKGERSQSTRPKKTEKLNKRKHEKHEKHDWIKPDAFQPDFVDSKFLTATLGDYERNSFVSFLASLFEDNPEGVESAVRSYFIGTFEGKTVFWQIDRDRNIRTGEIMLYDAQTGKRQKQTYIDRTSGETKEIAKNWMHDRLKRLGKLKPDFKHKLCYFGEHLVKDASQTVAIVEAAKTAVICSIVFPEYTWIAAGALGYLKAETLHRYKHNKIILYPDGNIKAFERWQRIADEANKQGLNVVVSTLINTFASDQQKQDGFDLADYLIQEQRDKARTRPAPTIKPQKCKTSILDPLETSLQVKSSELLRAYQNMYKSGVYLNFDADKIQAESAEPLDAETFNFISQNRRRLLWLAQRAALESQWFNDYPFDAEDYRMEIRERTAIILNSEKISGLQAMERASYEVTRKWYVLHQQLKGRPIMK